MTINKLDKRKRRPHSATAIESHHRVNFNQPGIQLENKGKAQFLFQGINILAEK